MAYHLLRVGSLLHIGSFVLGRKTLYDAGMKRSGKKNRASFFQKIFRYPNGLVFGIFIVSAIVVFRSFVFSGHPPFPGNYLQAWYEPWKSLHFSDGRILLPHKPVAEDVFRHILPFRLLGVEMLQRFQLPLWNPYNGSGQPLLATLNSGFLDPFNMLFTLLPAGLAGGIYVMVQFVLIALATYLYIRTLGLHTVTAVFAGLTFVLSGFVTIRLVFINYGLAIALLPLLLAAIEHVVKTRKGRILFVMPIGIALAVVSTQPQIVLYILGTVGLYGVVRLAGMYADWKKRLKMVGSFAALMGLGIALAGLQLFPTYEFMKLSHVTAGNSLDVIEKFFVPFTFLLSIPIPNFYGNTATYNYWGGSSDSIQTASYLGLLPVFLAFVSFLGDRKYRHIRMYFVLLAGISIAFAVRWFGSLALYSLPIPILSTGAPRQVFYGDDICSYRAFGNRV